MDPTSKNSAAAEGFSEDPAEKRSNDLALLVSSSLSATGSHASIGIDILPRPDGSERDIRLWVNFHILLVLMELQYMESGSRCLTR